jgi:hypothetical protein
MSRSETKRTAQPVFGGPQVVGICVFTVALFAWVHFLPAQATLSTLRGTASDASGAVVPGVDIVLTDVQTNTVRSVVTDEVGNFEILNIRLGKYRLEAKMSGFKTFVAENVILESSQVRRVDVRLEVGTASQEVTVNANAAVIETEQAKQSATVGQEQYQNMPIASIRKYNPNVLMVTLPGLQTSKTSYYTVSVTGLSGYNYFSEGMDGAPNDGSVNQIHNMEDVAELKVVTTVNTADISRVGYLNMTSKRGNNAFHGDASYYHSNSALNARRFFEPSKTSYKVHTFGINSAGPIVKDKTFFFASFNGRREPAGNWKLATVPTQKMHNGDFSELPSSYSVIDPLTNVSFQNRTIPASRINSTTKAILDTYYPLPNVNSLTNNYNWVHPYPTDLYKVDYVTARIDHQLTSKNELYGRISQRFTPYVLAQALPGTDWTRQRYAWQIAVNDNHIFSPSLVHMFRFGWYRNDSTDGMEVDGVQPKFGSDLISAMGIQGVNRSGYKTVGGPSFTISGYTTLNWSSGGVANANEISFADSINWTKGKHVWKFGFDLKNGKSLSDTVAQGNWGTFTFNGAYTSYAMADFLLGIPRTSVRLDPLTDRTYRMYELGLYVMDSYKVSKSLTLDYGLRWDYFGASTYDDGLMMRWDPDLGKVVVLEAALSKISPLYDPRIGVTSGDVVANPEKTNFAPRIGAAYRFNDKTVIRGGYGVFTEYLGQAAFAIGTGPFQVSETYSNAITNGVPDFQFPNPFPNKTAAIPSQSVTTYPRNVKNGYIQQISVSLEREIANTGFRLSYTGNRSRGLHYSMNSNTLPPSLENYDRNKLPYPYLTSVTTYLRDGKVNYDDLTFKVTRKMGQFTVDGFWTWAHSMSNYLRLVDWFSHYGWTRTSLVPNNKVVVNAMWRIPVGRGKQFLSNAHPVVDYVLGGWIVSWLTYLESGEWLTPTYSGWDPANTNTTSGPPDRIADGNLPKDERTMQRWFDTSAFTRAPKGRYGNTGYNIIEGPGLAVHSMCLTKRFRVGDRMSVEFTGAIGNLFNHPNFANPTMDINSLLAGKISADVGNDNIINGPARNIEGRLHLRW